jgi:hypothetical protein
MGCGLNWLSIVPSSRHNLGDAETLYSAKRETWFFSYLDCKLANARDFMLPPRSRIELRFYGLLRSM